MSRRTLQRRLAEGGASLRGLVDRARERLARAYLADTTLSVGAVAASVAYADLRSFTRAFQRCTGQSLSSFRRCESR